MKIVFQPNPIHTAAIFLIVFFLLFLSFGATFGKHEFYYAMTRRLPQVSIDRLAAAAFVDAIWWAITISGCCFDFIFFESASSWRQINLIFAKPGWFLIFRLHFLELFKLYDELRTLFNPRWWWWDLKFALKTQLSLEVTTDVLLDTEGWHWTYRRRRIPFHIGSQEIYADLWRQQSVAISIKVLRR